MDSLVSLDSLESSRPIIRYTELDLLRTLALAAMVLYHGLYDLTVLYGWDIALFTGPWKLMARATASLFLLLAGASFVVARARVYGAPFPWMKHIRRTGMILAGALAVTVVTYAADPSTYVRFGILHCIGISLLLLPFFRSFKEANIVLGLAIVLLGPVVQDTLVSTNALLPLGFMYPAFRSVDYFPLVPWFGVILLGAGIGHLVYVRLKRMPSDAPKTPSWLTWPGRHSLMVYLIHQPVILIVLLIVLGKPL